MLASMSSPLYAASASKRGNSSVITGLRSGPQLRLMSLRAVLRRLATTQPQPTAE
jgi:hypothetical protein